MAYIDFSNNDLYIYNFKTKVRTQITFANNPAITKFGNPVWTSDGQGIVVPGYQNGMWRLFFWTTGYSSATEITARIPSIDNEDPHFSVNGAKLTWKHDYGIAMADVTYPGGVPTLGTVLQVVTGTQDVNGNEGNEKSGPRFTPTGKYIYYWKGEKDNSVLWRYNTVNGSSLTLSKIPGLQYYYPATPDYYEFFYVRWADTGKRDVILIYSPLTHTTTEWDPADCSTDKGDPESADEDYIVYTRFDTDANRYRLYLGSIATGASWSLPVANGTTGGWMVGASYTPVQSP